MEALVVQADEVRRGLLRAAMRVRALRYVFVRPGLRIPLAAALSVVLSAVVSLLAPATALFVGAAVLGLPHVLSGVRHVALRRGSSRLTRLATGAALAMGLASVLGFSAGSRAMIALFTFAIAGEILEARATSGLKAMAMATLAAAALFTWGAPLFFVVGITHVHAVSSIALFSVVARRRGFRTWPLWLLTGAVVVMVTSGQADSLLAQQSWARTLGPDGVVRAIGAFVPASSHAWLRRSLFLYAFGQSLHYAVWLRLMPEVDRPSPLPWSFRKAYAELERDLGRFTQPLLGGIVLGSLAIVAFGNRGRDAYFALVMFHIGLEAAAFARLALQPGLNAPARGTLHLGVAP